MSTLSIASRPGLAAAAGALVALVGGGLALTPPASACGGFFCNAVTQTPIIQAGERILFAPHDGLVTMHIEIVYQGEPTQFGWLLPIAQAPMDATGNLLPLDQAVSISSSTLFTRLQALTDPSFQVNNTFAPDETCNYSPTTAGGGTDATAFADAASAADTISPAPPVTVLSEAKVGPYDAQLIHATRSDALYAWLNDNGYLQDPAAQPLLDHYVGKGFDFIGIRLQSGKTTGDLRPLAITLGEDAPCVPLKLTRIAASTDMPILVWVLGDARAVPKNFIHAQLNDLAFSFPGGGDYQGLVSQALDAAGRRAWVTEFAGDTAPLRGFLLPDNAYSPSALARATTLGEALDALQFLNADADFQSVLSDNVPKPADLRGYPFASCYSAIPWDNCLADADHVTTDAEFYGFLAYYADRAEISVDLDALRAALEAEVFAPRRGIEALFARAPKLTRFFALLDPTEMTRDPIFAFNPDLPDVSNIHVVDTVIHTRKDCTQYVDATYADGRRWRIDCGSFCGFPFLPGVPGQAPLLWPEVLDESGPAVTFDPKQATDIDQLLDDATPGSPSLPASYAITPPPAPSVPTLPPIGTAVGTSTSSGSGCVGGGGAGGPLAALIGIAGLLAWRRREGAPSAR